MYIGTNGLGGVTITGPLDNYEVDKNEKRGTYHISFTVRSTMGPYDVDMNVSSGGQADATVRGAFRGSIRYSGYLVHPSETRIFQGQSRF